MSPRVFLACIALAACATSPPAPSATAPKATAPVAGAAGGPRPSEPFDVFTTLQRNAWYLPTRDGKARLYVTEIGRGPTVVVLHGGPGNDFQYLVDALRPHLDRYHFVLFDQRGSLLSPVPADQLATLTLDSLIDDLEVLRVALGQPRLALLGHSWGSFLAMAYYRAHPAHVAGLVLTATPPPRCGEGASFLDVIKAAHARMKPLRERPGVRTALDAVEGDTARASTMRSRIQLAAINLWHVERWAAFAGGGVYYNGDVDGAIGDSVPLAYDTLAPMAAHPIAITVAQGDHDYLDPAAATWSSVVPRPRTMTVHVVAGAGHYAWIDNPEGFSGAVADGLARATPDEPVP